MADDEGPAALMPEPAPVPQVPNLKLRKLDDAVEVAQAALDAVAPGGSLPTASISAILATGWISDPKAGAFIESLDANGGFARNGFTDALSDLESAASAERSANGPMVDQGHPSGSTFLFGPRRWGGI